MINLLLVLFKILRELLMEQTILFGLLLQAVIHGNIQIKPMLQIQLMGLNGLSGLLGAVPQK
jgi:hypothetical protein